MIDRQVVFVGRKNARSGNYGMAAFFLAFLAMTTAMPLMSDRGREFFVGFAVLCDAFWLLMLGLTLQNIQATRQKITIDPRGLTIEGPGARSVLWSQATAFEQTDSRSTTYRLRVQGERPVVLRVYLIEDGLELARIVGEQVVAKAPANADVTVYRPQNLPLQIAAGSVMLLLVAAGIGFAMAAPARPEQRGNPVLVLIPIALLYAWALVSSVSRYVRWTPTSLVLGSLFSRKELRFDAGVPIEISDRERTLRVASGGVELAIPKGLANFPELRARLQGQGAQVAAAPVAAQAVTPLPVATTFSGKTSEGVGAVVMSLVVMGFGIMMVGMGASGINRGGLGPAIGLMLLGLVPGLLGLFGAFSATEFWKRYSVDAQGISREGKGGGQRLKWSEITRAWRVESDLTGYRLEGLGGSMTIQTSALKDGETLRRLLEERTAEARRRAAATAEGRWFGVGPDFRTMGAFLFVMGLVMLGALVPILNGSLGTNGNDLGARIMFAALTGGCGLFMMILAVSVWLRRVKADSTELEVRSLGKARIVRYREITRAEMGVRTGSRGGRRTSTLSLEHPEGAVRIDASLQDFDLLQAFVLSKVDPSIIRTSPDAPGTKSP